MALISLEMGYYFPFLVVVLHVSSAVLCCCSALKFVSFFKRFGVHTILNVISQFKYTQYSFKEVLKTGLALYLMLTSVTNFEELKC